MKVEIENKIYKCDNCGKPLEWETQIIMDNDDAFCSQKCSNEYYKDESWKFPTPEGIPLNPND